MRGDLERFAVREGDVLVDKYRVERVLGTGGMGIVVAARHLRLEEHVAIKLLHPDALISAEAVARFEREARAAAKIKSEHVARVSDVGTLDNGCPYMVMEYLEGEDLAQWLEKRGPFASEQAVEFILQTCEAMAEAHGLGIIHRDLKPANLFCIMRPDGRYAIKVLDFGISKVGLGVEITRADAVMGSPLYMSPEQMVSARSVDLRTDIWSLGVILYELISGQGAFRGDNYTEVCMNVARKPAPLLRAAVPDAPAGLEAVIARCLEKDRNKRYANVAELAAALGPFAPKRARPSVTRIARVVAGAGLSDSPMALPPSSNPTEGSGPATMASWGQPAAKDRRHRAGLGVAALFGLGVGAIVATWALQRSAPPTAKALDRGGTSAAPVAVDPAAPSIGAAAHGLPETAAPGASAAAPAPTSGAPNGTEATSGSESTASTAVASTPARPKPAGSARQPSGGPKAPAHGAPPPKRNELGGRL
jgi:serine/threonine-protein kinase